MNCKYWYGTKYSQEADCYMVIGSLEHDLFMERNELDYFFNVPFDPHEYYRYHVNSRFFKLYKNIMKNLPSGVSVDKQDKKLYFFKTAKDYSCEYFERRM
jgi:hypothetical protein